MPWFRQCAALLFTRNRCVLCRNDLPFSPTFQPSISPHEAAHSLLAVLVPVPMKGALAAINDGDAVAKKPHLSVVETAVAFLEGRVALDRLGFVVAFASGRGALKIVGEKCFANSFLRAAVLRPVTLHLNHLLRGRVVL